jgi:hypothetical protein
MLSPLSNRGGSDSATNFSFFRRPGTAPATPAPSPPANKPAENGTLPEAPVGGEGFIGGDYTGIILRPELKPVTLLVPPLMSTHNGGVTQVSKPLSIPFGGEYWMYRWPFARPPRNAVVKRGAPANLSFKTTDHVPLLMEARHRLEQPLSIRCCRAIQVEITNADTLANTVYLEVILINNTHPSTQPTLLGSQPVNSVPEKNQPAAELLRFPFPNSPTITQFDEIRILFHRAISRADRSARASINRFVLIP